MVSPAASKRRGTGTLAERASFGFVLRHPAHALALGGGVGLLPAPGTAATLVTLPLYWSAFANLPWLTQWLLWLLFVPLTLWSAGRTARSLGDADPSVVVIDEMHAFLAVLIVLPSSLQWQSWGFLLFRVFDIFKPPPVGWADRRFSGGLGIVLDDWLAAAMTLLVLSLIARVGGL